MLITRLDILLPELAERIGPFSPMQQDNMESALAPLMRRARQGKLTPAQKSEFQVQVRKIIVGELTPDQKARLKATRRGQQDLLDRKLRGGR